MRKTPVTPAGDRRGAGPVAVAALRLAVGTVLLAGGTLASNAIADTGAAGELDGFDCVVEPSAVVDLGAAVPGVLAETSVDRGDRVASGEKLGQLESRLEEVGVRIAEAIATSATGVDLRAATSAFGARTSSRNERLAATSAVSEQTLDQVRTEARIAGLQLQQERESQALAELELERARADVRELAAPGR